MHLISRINLLTALSILSIFLSSCDPAQTIYIENQTSAPASILFTFNPGAQEYRFPEADASDTFLVRLDTLGASQEFYFGMGTWDITYSMDSLVAAVASIEIKSIRSSESFVGPQQVRTFFIDRMSKRKDRIELILD